MKVDNVLTSSQCAAFGNWQGWQDRLRLIKHHGSKGDIAAEEDNCELDIEQALPGSSWSSSDSSSSDEEDDGDGEGAAPADAAPASPAVSPVRVPTAIRHVDNTAAPKPAMCNAQTQTKKARKGRGLGKPLPRTTLRSDHELLKRELIALSRKRKNNWNHNDWRRYACHAPCLAPLPRHP